MQSVTDSYSFTYAANQVSSQWVIERIDLPNGEFNSNAEGELIYANFASPTNGNLRRVYMGSGKMAQVDGVFGTRYFETWSITGDGYTGINGSLEPTFATIKGPGTSNAQMRLAIPPTYVDEQGRQYDSDPWIISS